MTHFHQKLKLLLCIKACTQPAPATQSALADEEASSAVGHAPRTARLRTNESRPQKKDPFGISDSLGTGEVVDWMGLQFGVGSPAHYHFTVNDTLTGVSTTRARAHAATPQAMCATALLWEQRSNRTLRPQRHLSRSSRETLTRHERDLAATCASTIGGT